MDTPAAPDPGERARAEMLAALNDIAGAPPTLDERIKTIGDETLGFSDALQRVADQVQYLRRELATVAGEVRDIRKTQRRDREWALGALGILLADVLLRWWHLVPWF